MLYAKNLPAWERLARIIASALAVAASFYFFSGNTALLLAASAVGFALTGLVDWPRMAIMLAGAVLGYWLGAHYSQKIPQTAVRRIVIAVGLTISAAMFWRLLRS